MRLIFAGTPAVALPSLEALIASQHEVLAVITRPAARAGRGRSLRPSPVAERAAEAGIEVLTPASPRDLDFQARLRELNPDAVPVVAYGALVPAELLELPEHGWINLHFSLLPAWRGAAPVQYAVMAGDEVTGASTFRLEKGLDTGPVFGTLTETVRPRDTAGDLLDRLSVAGAELLVRTLDALDAGVLTPVPQPAEGVSLAPSLSVDDARVRWTHPALAVDRRVRGCTPAPGAWTTLPDGTRLGLGPVRLAPEVTDLAPGELRAGRQEVWVGTASHAVLLDEVRPAGKKPMRAADWARGARLPESVVLGAHDGDLQ